MNSDCEFHEKMRCIEKALNAPTFRGYEMGATINDIIVTGLLNGNYSVRFILRTLLKSSIALVKPPSAPVYSPSLCNRIVFTWVYNRPDFRDLVVPLVKRYGPEQSLVIGSMADMRSALPAGTAFVTWRDIGAFDRDAWLNGFVRAAPRWLAGLARELRNRDLSLSALPLLFSAVISQTQKIMACESFIAHATPRAVITEFDRNWFASCLVLAANRVQIPTFTMVHGALNPYPAYGMFPTIAGHVLCWGELQKRQFLECGEHPNKLHITGCQRLSKNTISNREEVRARIGIPDETLVLILPTNPIKPKLKLKLARSFCQGIANVAGVIGLIRLHPGERVHDYQSIVREFPSIRIMTNDILSVDESLAACDVVVCHNTGYGSDALIKGRTTIILDSIDLPLLSARELIDSSGCACVRTSDELKQTIMNIKSNADFSNGNSNRANSYVNALCAAFGEDALNNVVKVIDREALCFHTPTASEATPEKAVSSGYGCQEIMHKTRRDGN